MTTKQAKKVDPEHLILMGLDYVTCRELLPLSRRSSFHALRCNTIIPLPLDNTQTTCPQCGGVR